MCECSGSHGRCPCPNSDKGFDWNTGYQNLIHFHQAGPRWDVDQDFFVNYRSADQPVKLLSLICAYAIRCTSVD